MVISAGSHNIVVLLRLPLIELDAPDCRTMCVEVGELIDLGPSVALFDMTPDKQVTCLEAHYEGIGTL